MSSLRTALYILCTVACCAAEIPSPHRAAEYRPGYHHRYQYQNQSNFKRRHIDQPVSANRYGSPIFRYDYAQANQRKSHGYKPYNQLERNPGKPYTTGVYRTYGKGSAIIPRPGATVAVLNTAPHPKAYKGTITARVLSAPEPNRPVMARMTLGPRKNCFGCPDNHAVVASKGNAEVILPKPCPTMRWVSISGPQPGARLPEGTHTIIGRLGHRGKICRYEYQVVVRRCGAFSVDRGRANCTAEDAWGSTCSITCDEGFEVVGSPKLTCQDDLKWSDDPPVCKKKIWCPLPQTPDDTKIWCQVDRESDLTEDKLPANTHCRFRSEGRQHVITCVDGYWVTNQVATRRMRYSKRKKHHREKLEHNRLKPETVYPKAQVEILDQDH
ncbi:UNVERIFIED_CONTAM: hypothetical protein PYX00_000737 [Menopon gallinae]|uniref:Sushi domain-containing protein n=1 Tax=Menopon gallinae TaxID=328185 RepID=A0AAW2IBD7_9NEOP